MTEENVVTTTEDKSPTTFHEIYEIFLFKITDFDLSYMTDDEMSYWCFMLMKSALNHIRLYPIVSTLEIDADKEQFKDELLDIEQELITLKMVSEWYESQVNTSMLTKQFIGTKDEKFFAQANQIEKLEMRAKSCELKARKLRRDYKYTTSGVPSIKAKRRVR